MKNQKIIILVWSGGGPTILVTENLYSIELGTVDCTIHVKVDFGSVMLE